MNNGYHAFLKGRGFSEGTLAVIPDKNRRWKQGHCYDLWTKRDIYILPKRRNGVTKLYLAKLPYPTEDIYEALVENNPRPPIVISDRDHSRLVQELKHLKGVDSNART